MKHRELFVTSEFMEGRCIACDAQLVGRMPGKRTSGAPRSVLCGTKKCLRTYHQLRRARLMELARLALSATF